MGYHIILDVKCKLLPQYVNYVRKYRFFENEETSVVEGDDESFFVELLEIWDKLKIEHHFYKYQVDVDNVFSFTLQKKPYHHDGNLENDYLRLMYEIIAPISSKIIECSMRNTEYIMEEPDTYSDIDIRNMRFGRRFVF